jgi:uncharacterized membrane protein YqjE
LVRTALGAVENRIELFTVEWEEERIKLMEALIWAAALVLHAILAILLLTATIIFLFSPDIRIYVAIAFALLYLIGAIAAGLGLRRVVRRQSFPESLSQLKQDRVWLESLK